MKASIGFHIDFKSVMQRRQKIPRSVYFFKQRVCNRGVAARELQKLVTGSRFLAGGIEFPKKFSHR